MRWIGESHIVPGHPTGRQICYPISISKCPSPGDCTNRRRRVRNVSSAFPALLLHSAPVITVQ